MPSAICMLVKVVITRHMVLQMSLTLCLNPIYLMLTCSICCSYAFMLPVATAPNAIVFSHSTMKTSGIHNHDLLRVCYGSCPCGDVNSRPSDPQAKFLTTMYTVHCTLVVATCVCVSVSASACNVHNNNNWLSFSRLCIGHLTKNYKSISANIQEQQANGFFHELKCFCTEVFKRENIIYRRNVVYRLIFLEKRKWMFLLGHLGRIPVQQICFLEAKPSSQSYTGCGLSLSQSAPP